MNVPLLLYRAMLAGAPFLGEVSNARLSCDVSRGRAPTNIVILGVGREGHSGCGSRSFPAGIQQGALGLASLAFVRTAAANSRMFLPIRRCESYLYFRVSSVGDTAQYQPPVSLGSVVCGLFPIPRQHHEEFVSSLRCCRLRLPPAGTVRFATFGCPPTCVFCTLHHRVLRTG